MALSDAQFSAWLARPNAPRCVLAEFTHSAGVLYASSHGFVSAPDDTPPNTPYPAWLTGAPTLSESLLGEERGGTLELINDGALDAELTRAYPGWPVTLYLGDSAWPKSDFRPVLAATIQEVTTPALNRLTFNLRDRRERLRVAITSTRLADQRPPPIALGYPFNIEPLLTTAATLTYTVHSGAVAAITAVRDNGTAVSFTPNASAGTFTLTNTPYGRITADVTGPATYGHTLAGLVEWLARAAGLGSGDLDATNLAAFANTDPLGWFGTGDTLCWEALQDLANAAGAALIFSPTGQLQLYRLAAPNPVADAALTADLIEAGGLTVTTLEAPYDAVHLTHSRNWTPQDLADLAGSVTVRYLYNREHQSVSASNALRATWPLAEQPTVNSFFISSGAAQAEADRRAALRNTARRILTVNALTPAWEWRLGQTIQVTYPRYGLDAGQNFVLVRKTLALRTLRVTVDLWG